MLPLHDKSHPTAVIASSLKLYHTLPTPQMRRRLISGC